MKPPIQTAGNTAIDAEDIQHAGEIAAPPSSVADPVPPPIASHANPRAAAMASRPLWKTFLLFLAPMLLSNILQSLSGTLNNVYLGQMIGVGALAAVSGFFPVMFFFIAFTIGLGAGASVLIGQAWGAREPDKARAVAGTTLTVGVLFGLCVALFGGAFTEPLLRLLGTPPDILADATQLRAHHADRDAGSLRVPAVDGDAARRRRHGDAALHADDLDRARPGDHAGADPRLVRPAAARRGQRRLRHRDLVRRRDDLAGLPPAAQEEPARARCRLRASPADRPDAAQGACSRSACRPACR